MKAIASISLLWAGLGFSVFAQHDAVRQAQSLEGKGDAMAARAALLRAVRQEPNNPSLLNAYAEFLDRYGDPETRTNYERLLGLLERSGNAESRATVARRLVVLDMLEGNRDAAERHLAQYRAAGGREWNASIPAPRANAKTTETGNIYIPGPLRSFARMAAITPELPPLQILPALARNVVTNGYQAGNNSESLEPTEYMKLIMRYLSQARELQRLAGDQKVIRIETCESSQTADLLRILGYRMRGACGTDLVLETVNAARAFLTIDSGFPLAELEQALRTSRPFSYEYRATPVPVIYGPDYWISAKDKQQGEFIDVFLGDPSLCRVYLGMAKLDQHTADELRAAVPLQRLKPFAHVLDFFGGMFELRNGKAVVPGDARTAQAWAELVGVSPDQGAAFFERLIAKDDGWLASYFDALGRVNGPVRDYLTEPNRMQRFYTAIRGRITSPGPARPVFRANTDLMLLTTRLRIEPDGRPHIPGGLAVWKSLIAKYPNGKIDNRLAKAAAGWNEPDELIEALFALCRKAVDNEPLKNFLALSDVNRRRSRPLEPATVDRLAREYRLFSAQYPIFSECPSVSDASIISYLDAARDISKIGDVQLRANAAGTLQGLVSLWQILSRQGSIPDSEADQVLAGIVAGFANVRKNVDLFDIGRNGIQLVLKAAHGNPNQSVQEQIIGLLAGGNRSDDEATRNQVQQNIIRILEAQRLVSLDTLFEAADNLESASRGETPNHRLLSRLTSRISEIQLPRANLTTAERNQLSYGYWTDRHIDAQRKLNLKAVIERAKGDPEKMKEARGLLAPFLRDSLVGFNYAYYAPPGAEVLHANPLFVRNHDFIGLLGAHQTWKQAEVVAGGWPMSAGGRLSGSMVGLPYALAEAEQNFMVPAREQALIWGDLVPQLILSATIPRWWNVTPSQMHWVGLHMRLGESVIAESALDAEKREQTARVLGRQAVPARQAAVLRYLEQGDVRAALDNVTPEEMFVLGTEAAREGREPDIFVSEIKRLQSQSPESVNYQMVSSLFGTPKPTLTNSYRPELLHLRTFPTLMGYSSRIMAETWESTLLYWASIADQVHVPPSQMNLLVPEWTKQTVERIFATHLEDWPALLKSIRNVGDDVRTKLRIEMDPDQKASLQ